MSDSYTAIHADDADRLANQQSMTASQTNQEAQQLANLAKQMKENKAAEGMQKSATEAQTRSTVLRRGTGTRPLSAARRTTRACRAFD